MAADVDITEFVDRNADLAPATVSQPKHPVVGAHNFFKLGAHFLGIGVVAKFDGDFFRVEADSETYVHATSFRPIRTQPTLLTWPVGQRCRSFAMMRAMVLRRQIGSLVVLVAIVSAALAGCSSGPKRDANNFCRAYVAVAREGAAFGDPSEMSLAAIQEKADRLEREATKATKSAPRDIEDDIVALLAPLKSLNDALAAATTHSQALTALRTYRSRVDKLDAHQQRLSTWAKAHCDVVPVTTTSTSTPATETIKTG